MATPVFPRNYVFLTKKKHQQIRPRRNFLRCGNPHCRWVYKYAPTAYESALLQTVCHVAHNTCCQEPRHSYFCPSAAQVQSRCDAIKKQLYAVLVAHPDRQTEIEQRIGSLDRHVRRLQRYAGPGCYTKFQEYRAKVAEAEELLRQRTIYAKHNNATLEQEFPASLRFSQNQHLREVLNFNVNGVEISSMFRPLVDQYDEAPDDLYDDVSDYVSDYTDFDDYYEDDAIVNAEDFRPNV